VSFRPDADNSHVRFGVDAMPVVSSLHKRPFFFISLLWAAGILISWYATPILSFKTLLISAFLLLLLALSLYKSRPAPFAAFTALLFICLGALAGWQAFYLFAPGNYGFALSNLQGFHGRVIEAQHSSTGHVHYLIAADSLKTPHGWQPAKQRIYLTQGRGQKEMHYGDVLCVLTTVERPLLPANPGAFNMRRYLNLNGIFLQARLNKNDPVEIIRQRQGPFVMIHIVLAARRTLSTIITRYLPPGSAAIVRALILGQRQDIGRDVLLNFQKTGVVHVLAISGLHVGFIVLLLYGLLALVRVPSRPRLVTLTVFLLFFIILVNFKAPVMRASLMIVLLLLGREMSRPQDSLQVLGLAAWILLAFQPQQLLMPGFQFSFAAVGGLLLGTPKLKKALPAFSADHRLGRMLNKYLRLPALASLCAVLATLPLTWYYYGMLQTGAVFVNIVIIPYIGLVVMLAILFLFFALIPGMPAAGLAWILDTLIRWMLTSVAGLARLPFIYLRTARPGSVIVLLVFGIILGMYFYPRKSARRFLVFLTALLVFIGGLNLLSRRYRLRVSFINVGQGDAALLEFPNGKNMLIDGGDRNFSFDAGEYYVAPFLQTRGVRHLDYLLGTHPHSDHVGGFISLIRNFEVDTLILNEFVIHTKLYTHLLQTARRRHVVLRHRQSGDILSVDHKLRVFVLHPTDRFEHGAGQEGELINNSSIVLKVLYGKTSFLLTGDAQGLAETAIDRYGAFLNCDVLKVGHHGSLTSSAPAFLKWARPKYAVISVGRNNKFHHPGKLTLWRLAHFGADVLRTDRVGAVLFESDGQNLRLLRWH